MNRLKPQEINFMFPPNSIESDRLTEYKSDKFIFTPTTSSANPKEGEVYYDKDTRKLKVWTGSQYEEINST